MTHLFYTRDLFVCRSCGKRHNNKEELDKHLTKHQKQPEKEAKKLKHGKKTI